MQAGFPVVHSVPGTGHWPGSGRRCLPPLPVSAERRRHFPATPPRRKRRAAGLILGFPGKTGKDAAVFAGESEGRIDQKSGISIIFCMLLLDQVFILDVSDHSPHKNRLTVLDVLKNFAPRTFCSTRNKRNNKICPCDDINKKPELWALIMEMKKLKGK